MMEETYIEHLKKEQKNASSEFEQAKQNAIQEIKDLASSAAINFGTAYAYHINKISRTAANLESITEAINVYEYLETNREKNDL